ncbi:hypothetical protein M8845_14980 [Gelidibacter japonicus]|uniref:hypothetical protein n=1 Tax=Gelidibacter japonicus TaxID=1962232 RepID=UPI002020D2C7|nr:hypothetical protein [Gelidibacter japonicus]MCL8008731.1 hypothetical protein [Gelidibacter japonicus]
MKSLIILLSSCFTIISCGDSSTDYLEETTKSIQKQSVVFIAGTDEGDNSFYKNTKAHFSQQNITIVKDLHTLDAIILWLNNNADSKVYDQIHIVSYSNPWRGMALLTSEDGERITAKSLKNRTLPKLNCGITENTKIIFHSCGLGVNKNLMKGLKLAFSSDVTPTLYASEYYNVFGGKYASHYLAQPFYVFYPTANSPGNKMLSQEIAMKYPNANLDWLTALDTREERTSGAIYSYRFNIPIDWEFVFEDASETPHLDNTDRIIDYILENEECSFVLYELGIPMEKFRWTSRSEGNVLKIQGKTTVLTVLMPLMNTYEPAEYTAPDITHARLYSQF